jgi:proteasome lid subunit RPN8/RPN11
LASDQSGETIRIPILVWARLVRALERKGRGRNESGAFLLGRKGKEPRRVVGFLCYDDLDPHAYDTGAITFHAIGYEALWRHCKERGFEVLCDAHTHPGADVRQSSIDQKNPMIPITGHTAIVVPHFGRSSMWSLGGVGIYEYCGSQKWQPWPPSSRPPRIKLTIW